MVSDCPGAKANLSASRAGTSKVTAAESSVSGSTRATVSGWNSVRDTAGGHQISFTYSKGSRQASQRNSALQAVALKAAVCVVSREPHRGQRDRLAARGEGQRDRATRGGGARCGGAMPAARSLPRPSRGDPVAAPGGRERGAHGDVGEAGLAEPVPQVVRDLAQRRAARVGRRDRHHQAPVLGRDVAQDAEVGHRHHGQLGIGHRRGDLARGFQAGRGGHHVASGWARATLCNSASM